MVKPDTGILIAKRNKGPKIYSFHKKEPKPLYSKPFCKEVLWVLPCSARNNLQWATTHQTLKTRIPRQLAFPWRAHWFSSKNSKIWEICQYQEYFHGGAHSNLPKTKKKEQNLHDGGLDEVAGMLSTPTCNTNSQKLVTYMSFIHMPAFFPLSFDC